MTTGFRISELRFGCWNIHGLFKNFGGFKYSKLHDDYVQDIIMSNHIFGLVETHHTGKEASDLYVKGFHNYSVCREKNKKKASGGICVFVKNELRAGVCKVPYVGSELLCLKLKKDFFHLNNDIYLTVCYCAPSNSTVLRRLDIDIYEQLSDALSEFANKGDLILTPEQVADPIF